MGDGAAGGIGFRCAGIDVDVLSAANISHVQWNGLRGDDGGRDDEQNGQNVNLEIDFHFRRTVVGLYRCVLYPVLQEVTRWVVQLRRDEFVLQFAIWK
jgi:hypothetical protein